MRIKDKIFSLIRNNKNEDLLKEIYDILRESEHVVNLTDIQLNRLDIAEDQTKKGEVKGNDDIMNKYLSNELINNCLDKTGRTRIR